MPTNPNAPTGHTANRNSTGEPRTVNPQSSGARPDANAQRRIAKRASRQPAK